MEDELEALRVEANEYEMTTDEVIDRVRTLLVENSIYGDEEDEWD